MTSWNSGAERINGYSKDEMLGQHFSRFFTFEDQVAGKPAQLLAAARANQRFDEEAWRIRKDGTRFWASVVIEPMWDKDGPAAEANMWVTLMRLKNITAVWSGCRSHDQNGGEVCV